MAGALAVITSHPARITTMLRLQLGTGGSRKAGTELLSWRGAMDHGTIASCDQSILIDPNLPGLRVDGSRVTTTWDEIDSAKVCF